MFLLLLLVCLFFLFGWFVFVAIVGLFVVCFQICVVVVIVLVCFWGQGQDVVIIICWSVN